MIVEQANRSAFFRALQQTTHKTPPRDSRTEPPITTPAFVQQAAPDLGVCIFPTLVAGLRFNPPAHALALSVSVRSTIRNSCTHPKQNRRRRRCPSPYPTRHNIAPAPPRPARASPPRRECASEHNAMDVREPPSTLSSTAPAAETATAVPPAVVADGTNGT